MTHITHAGSPGRVAQRRHTRDAIVEAAATLISGGETPSLHRIADGAGVSKRTISVHFPRLDDLMVEATLGVLRKQVEEALASIDTDDPRTKASLTIQAISRAIADSVPLGRKAIKLTVDMPSEEARAIQRGWRRVRTIESSLADLRPSLPAKQFEGLVSALAIIIAWESFIALIDVRGMSPDAAYAYTTALAEQLIDDAFEHAERERISSELS